MHHGDARVGVRFLTRAMLQERSRDKRTSVMHDALSVSCVERIYIERTTIFKHPAPVKINSSKFSKYQEHYENFEATFLRPPSSNPQCDCTDAISVGHIMHVREDSIRKCNRAVTNVRNQSWSTRQHIVDHHSKRIEHSMSH